MAAVKALYREMGLEQVFFDYEQASTVFPKPFMSEP